MQTLPSPGLAGSTPSTSGGSGERPGAHSRGSRRNVGAWSSAASAVTVLIVAGVTAFVIAQIRPGLIFGPNMDVGGDNAAHVVAVYYFIHHLLPRLQLSGWDPQWFGGFPLYVFYFPLPAVLIAAFSWVFGYAVAFKVVTVLGVVLMPVAAYTFGRLAGFRRPIPALMSAGMLPFIFLFAPSIPGVNVSWNIDGGTLASTLAGEFSFTLGVSVALFFLGVYAYALRTGRLRWLAALLYPATLLCHVVPAIFAAAAAVVLTVAVWSRRALVHVLLPVGLVGGLLSAFWLLPFGAYLRYSSSMNYWRVGDAWQNLIPFNGEQAVQWLALIGLLLAIWRRERIAVAVGLLALGALGGFLFLPSGLVYNGRWLPFWFLTTALLAAYAVGELGRTLFAAFRREHWHPVATGLVGGFASIILIAGWLGVLPFYPTPAANRNPVTGWVTWNYTGYQGKPGWGQFTTLVSMLERAAKVHGCGRLDYEYSPNTTAAFGSTLVPMSFPLWTDGCIQSAEGVYYESSTSNHFHFLDQAELSLAPSNPVVGLNYSKVPNVPDGIRHLQLTGVKYFLASSPTIEEAAAADPSLVRVGSSYESADVVDRTQGSPEPPSSSTFSWVLYEIRSSPIVQPLRYEPVVEAGMSKVGWQQMAEYWYQHEQYWPVPVVSSGPANWPTEPQGSVVGTAGSVPVPKTTVSDVRTGDESISFDVTRLGVPTLVKVPYFPNWQASGATGPYEATPNLMVVVPTAHHVVLTYGTTMVDWLGRTGTIVGIVGFAALAIAPAAVGLGTGTGVFPDRRPGDPEPFLPGGGEGIDDAGRDGEGEARGSGWTGTEPAGPGGAGVGQPYADDVGDELGPGPWYEDPSAPWGYPPPSTDPRGFPPPSSDREDPGT